MLGQTDKKRISVFLKIKKMPKQTVLSLGAVLAQEIQITITGEEPGSMNNTFFGEANITKSGCLCS